LASRALQASRGDSKVRHPGASQGSPDGGLTNGPVVTPVATDETTGHHDT
jgi:hypothetical protein